MSAPDEPPDGAARPSRQPFLLRLPPDLLAALRRWAAHDLRSLNAHIEYLLREALRRRAGRGPEGERGPGSG
ncbi:MAG: hypothetical protein AB1726_02740 [Planctomycetota bacterium]